MTIHKRHGRLSGSLIRNEQYPKSKLQLPNLEIREKESKVLFYNNINDFEDFNRKYVWKPIVMQLKSLRKSQILSGVIEVDIMINEKSDVIYPCFNSLHIPGRIIKVDTKLKWSRGPLAYLKHDRYRVRGTIVYYFDMEPENWKKEILCYKKKYISKKANTQTKK